MSRLTCRSQVIKAAHRRLTTTRWPHALGVGVCVLHAVTYRPRNAVSPASPVAVQRVQSRMASATSRWRWYVTGARAAGSTRSERCARGRCVTGGVFECSFAAVCCCPQVNIVTKPFVNKMKTLNVLSKINADFRPGTMTLVSQCSAVSSGAGCVVFFCEYVALNGGGVLTCVASVVGVGFRCWVRLAQESQRC